VADDCRRVIRGRYALISMCIGGGPGIAAIFKRV
jgi:acetyl-CoA acetyltransferase